MPKNKSLPTVGHNSASDELIAGYIKKLGKETDLIVAANGRIKAILADAKSDGLLKTALRKALKDLRMTEEQTQAAQQVQSAREEYVAVCIELGLFVPEKEAA